MRDDEQLKIELLRQWMLESEFRNMIPIFNSQNWNYLDSVYFVVTSLLKANIEKY